MPFSRVGQWREVHYRDDHNQTIDTKVDPWFPKKITDFDDINAINTNVFRPSNLSVVFVGDSLTRYQYLSLAYFLKNHEWVPIDQTPNLLVERMGHGNWSNFYRNSKATLSPLEECDCYRAPPTPGDNEAHWLTYSENRYYYDPSLGNSLVYINKMVQKYPFVSSWDYKDVHNQHELLTKADVEKRLEWHYSTDSWIEFIRNFIAKLEPKPRVFIFNQGLWPNHVDFLNPKTRVEIVNAIRQEGMIPVYKTTTKKASENTTMHLQLKKYEDDFCKLSDYCLDLSWTWHVPPSLYDDNKHFYSPVYTWSNIQVLELLSFIQEIEKNPEFIQSLE